jgi:outer membrane protein assembly factor BamB
MRLIAGQSEEGERRAAAGRPIFMRCRLLPGIAVPALALALALAGCGGAATTSSVPRPASTLYCGAPSDPYAWAEQVTPTGLVRWRTTRGASPVDHGGNAPVLEPLIAGPAAVFAQGGSVQALALANGQPLWSYAGGQSVWGLWRWQGMVVALTEDNYYPDRLTGLDAATGTVRWTRQVPGSGLVGPQVATADGGLAMIDTDGALEIVSLATGVVRWTHPDSSWLSLSALGSGSFSAVNGIMTADDGQGLAASDGVLIAVGDFGTAGYDDRTGRRLWSLGLGLGLPVQPAPVLADGDVLLADDAPDSAGSDVLYAIEPASGRVRWQAGFPASVALQAQAGPGGVAVDTDQGMYLLDPATGRRRWEATTDSSMLVGAGDVLTMEDPGSTRLADRSAADGQLRWSIPAAEFTQAAMADGLVFDENLAQSALNAYRLGTGALAWRSAFPGVGYPVQLAPAPGGVLVQAHGWACTDP